MAANDNAVSLPSSVMWVLGRRQLLLREVAALGVAHERIPFVSEAEA